MVTVEPLGQLVPGPAAAGVDCLDANNNLDLVRFAGRWYLAWRTAPMHFASADARLEVTSAVDLTGPWRHETTVALGADVREPRWVVDGDSLHLFHMELGTDPKRFQPRRTHRVRLSSGTDPGVWEHRTLDIEPGFVPWRTRRVRGRWLMLGYRGGESMYGPTPGDPAVQGRWSDDLEHWGPPFDIHQGGIECELVELADGRLLGVTRNEGPNRFGGDLLLGDDLGALRSRPIGRKLDSPNMFLWRGEPHVIARRSLAFGGNYDVAPPWLPGALRIRVDQGLWWVTRKRSALYRIDVARLDADSLGRNGIGPADAAVEWVADLPTRGDTSFAAVHLDEDGSLLVADYTSPTWVGDVPWVRGQLRPTVIGAYRIGADTP
ncbi:MAG: sialidase family protein [Acidimicrobiales bacterium]